MIKSEMSICRPYLSVRRLLRLHAIFVVVNQNSFCKTIVCLYMGPWLLELDKSFACLLALSLTYLLGWLLIRIANWNWNRKKAENSTKCKYKLLVALLSRANTHSALAHTHTLRLRLVLVLVLRQTQTHKTKFNLFYNIIAIEYMYGVLRSMSYSLNWLLNEQRT